MHRGTQETVDEYGAAILVHFELYGVSVGGDLDNHIDVVRNILAGFDEV